MVRLPAIFSKAIAPEGTERQNSIVSRMAGYQENCSQTSLTYLSLSFRFVLYC